MSKAPKYTGSRADLYEAYEADVVAIVERAKAIFGNGFQFSDLVEISRLIPSCYDLVKKAIGERLTKEDVIDAVQYIYWRIDPNIPLVPEPIEGVLEKTLIEDVLIPLAVKAAWEAVEKYKAKQ